MYNVYYIFNDLCRTFSFVPYYTVSGATYRFRVVATVDSGNSRQSPSSEKVYMTSVVQRQTGTLLPAPVILESRTLSSTEIFIGWQVSRTRSPAVIGIIRPIVKYVNGLITSAIKLAIELTIKLKT